MLSPLDALGAAAAAIRFVDFSITILSKSREIYSSASSSTRQALDLAIIQTSLGSRAQKIKERIKPDLVGSSIAEEDKITLALCNQCLDISTELEIVLSAVRSQDPNTKWKSVRCALKSMWRKGTIETLRSRLLEMRTALDSHVMSEIPSRIDFLALKPLSDSIS